MISYEPLFKTMKEKGITSYRLEKMGFSRATYYSIRKGNSVSTNTTFKHSADSPMIGAVAHLWVVVFQQLD